MHQKVLKTHFLDIGKESGDRRSWLYRPNDGGIYDFVTSQECYYFVFNGKTSFSDMKTFILQEVGVFL